MNVALILLPLLIALSDPALGEGGYKPQTGDLLFQDLDCGEFCDAIEKVTVGVNNKSFSHNGIVYIKGEVVYVIEAVAQGVVKTPFEVFLNRSLNSQNQPMVVAGRLKEKYSTYIPYAISKAISLLGKEYDYAFDITNDKYYCSELVYAVFRDRSGRSLFDLEPMTFVDPTTRGTFPAWVTYFEELGIPIPEGEPGLNPGGISRSNRIEIIFSYY